MHLSDSRHLLAQSENVDAGLSEMMTPSVIMLRVVPQTVSSEGMSSRTPYVSQPGVGVLVGVSVGVVVSGLHRLALMPEAASAVTAMATALVEGIVVCRWDREKPQD